MRCLWDVLAVPCRHHKLLMLTSNTLASPQHEAAELSQAACADESPACPYRVHKLTLLVHCVCCLLQLCGNSSSTVLLPKLVPGLCYERA